MTYPHTRRNDPVGRVDRPEPWMSPAEIPAGHHFEAVSYPNWRVVDAEEGERRRCRAGRPSCKNPSVAAVNRGRRRYSPPYGISDSWWHYCADHLFGSWIEDGQVVRWRLVKDREEP